MQPRKDLTHEGLFVPERLGREPTPGSNRVTAANHLLRELRRRCRSALQPYSGRGKPCLVELTGAEPADRAAVARQVAYTLGRPLWRVNNYIGETEKNLDRALRNASRRGAVLLFDEADALFGRRADIKDSHDRYANQEISYLLSRLETHRGIVILSTNRRNNRGSSGRRRAILINMERRPPKP